MLTRDTDCYLSRLKPRTDRQARPVSAQRSLSSWTSPFGPPDVMPALGGNPSCGGIIAVASVALFERVEEFLRPVLGRWPDQVRHGVDVADASQWILRALLSLLTVEGLERRAFSGQVGQAAERVSCAVSASSGVRYPRPECSRCRL